jgi:chromosome segregation ATPase
MKILKINWLLIVAFLFVTHIVVAQNGGTVTISKTEYERLKQQVSEYQTINTQLEKQYEGVVSDLFKMKATNAEINDIIDEQKEVLAEYKQTIENAALMKQDGAGEVKKELGRLKSELMLIMDDLAKTKEDLAKCQAKKND